MSPSDVWVIYNKITKEIVWVAAECFLVQRKWDDLADEVSTPMTKTNREKLIVTTLKRALDEIELEHKSEIDYLREEKELQSRWGMY